MESTGKTQINQNGDLHVHHVKEDQKETGGTLTIIFYSHQAL